MDYQAGGYRLLRRPAPPPGPLRLDAAQQAVVSHPGGPLLVLAGPGTGKTTAIVEAVVERITERQIDPERVLVLTFSRKAAQELRERITTRLRRTTRQPLALTFHSYAYALVRREFVLAGDQPPTLLSGPEQLLEVRRMLRAEGETGAAGRWPERLRPALATRGFAAELRDFLLRAAERGLDGRGLARLGRARGRDDWVAAGGFLDRYAARFDLAPVPAYDYAEIVRIAAALLGRTATRDRERKAYDVVLVDEYQDTDPAQEALLHALAGDGRELIAVGDPDQSIYAFRGADTHAMGRFPDLFRAPDDRPASVIALRTCRRSGAGAAGRVAPGGQQAAGGGRAGRAAGRRRLASRARPAGRRTASGTRAAGRRAGWGPPGHRDLIPLATATAGTARVLIASSAQPGGRGDRRHAAPGAPDGRGAVVVDGGPGPVGGPAGPAAPPGAGRGRGAGVVAGDELPLAAEPGTRPLLALLRCALQPGALDEESAADLLTGPLGGTDALGLRRLRRALHARRIPRPASRREPRRWPARCATRGSSTWPAGRRGGRAARRRRRGCWTWPGAPPQGGDGPAAWPPGSAYEVLWAVWHASGLGAEWQAASAAGGSRGEAADRDLDAVVALFDAAARFAARLPPGSPWLFLDSLGGQEIPGDTLADRAPQGEAVRILTAHRSKGLEWDVVVVAGVQEGTWPDLRMRVARCWAWTSWSRRPRAGPRSAGPGRRAGRRRRGRAGLQAARRGAQAVLRRGHPGAARAGRHRGGR